MTDAKEKTMKDFIEDFEGCYETEVTDIILLGKNGSVRRIILGTEEPTYFG